MERTSDMDSDTGFDAGCDTSCSVGFSATPNANFDAAADPSPAPLMNILVIEDDPSINDIVCKRLAKDGHALTSAFSGTEAKMLLESKRFDLVITDLMLPGLAGDELVPYIRRSLGSLPIIVISARTSSVDKVDLLTLGADDYLSKPFDLDELAARVKVQLRRSGAGCAEAKSGAQCCEGDTSSGSTLGSRSDRAQLELGPLRLDPAQRRLSVSGEDVLLTRTEFDMLHLLMSRPKQVFTKQDLYEHVWNEPYPGQENSVNAHISNIRAKLRETAADGCIQTVWGIGFKLELP